MDEIKRKLKGIFEDVLDFDFESEGVLFADSLKPGDLDDWDSLSQINILAQIEKAFQVKFTIDDLIGLVSVGAIVESVASKLKG